MVCSPGLRFVVALIGALALSAPASALAAAPATPAAPGLSGAISAPSLSGVGPTAVAISGQYAYTTEYFPGQLAAINISNPASPTLAGVSAAAASLQNASNIQIAGGYAYVVSKNRNGPCLPGPAPACGMSVNDDGSGNSLTILDIHTNPAVPAVVGHVTSPTGLFGAYGLALSGGYAFIAAQGLLANQPSAPDKSRGAFTVVNVSNPANPTIVVTLDNASLPAPFGSSDALDHACSVWISGNYAYVTAEYSDRLTVIDISNPLTPTIVASLPDTSNLRLPVDVAVSGNDAYIADQTTAPGAPNFTVVDVSKPTSPAVVSSLTASSALAGAYRLRVHGNFAYISASATATVAAIDITNPAGPRLAGSVTDSGHLNNTTGLDIDPTGRYVVASSPYLSTEKQPLYPPFPGTPGAPTLTGTDSVITLDPVPIVVTIAPASKPKNPTNTKSASFSFSTSDAIATVACKLDGGAFGLCTTPGTQVYPSLAKGSHTFTVQATDAAGATSTASYMWTVGIPKKPTFSHTSLTGVAKGKPKLSFTLTAGVNAGALKTIVVGLPKGFSFAKAKRALAKGLGVKGVRGKRLKFTDKLSHGALTITLKTAAPKVQITIGSPSISVTGTVAGKVKKHKLKSVSVTLKTTDSLRKTVRLTLKLKPR
jgi:hypothetical protein